MAHGRVFFHTGFCAGLVFDGRAQIAGLVGFLGGGIFGGGSDNAQDDKRIFSRRRGNDKTARGMAGFLSRFGIRRASDDCHCYCNRRRRYYCRRGNAYRYAAVCRRVDRNAFGRQLDSDITFGGGIQFGFGNGFADHCKLYCSEFVNGRCDSGTRRAKRLDSAAHRGAFVCVLFRHFGGRYAAGRFGRICRIGDIGRRPDKNRLSGFCLRHTHGDITFSFYF